MHHRHRRSFLGIAGPTALLAAALGLSAPALAGTVVIDLTPDIDNTMYSETGDRSNGEGPHLYAGATFGASARRALVRFDVSPLPAGVTVLDVQLEVAVNRVAPGAALATHTLHRVTAEWGEGASNAGEPGGLGTIAEAGDATWTFRLYPTDPWTSPGGDFEAVVSASTDISTTGSYTFTGAGLVDDVQAWVDGAAPNHGWILLGDEANPGSAKRFDSRQNASGGPVLTITYEEEATPTDAASWSGVKARYRE
jgi:hypothetical protein